MSVADNGRKKKKKKKKINVTKKAEETTLTKPKCDPRETILHNRTNANLDEKK